MMMNVSEKNAFLKQYKKQAELSDQLAGLNKLQVEQLNDRGIDKEQFSELPTCVARGVFKTAREMKPPRQRIQLRFGQVAERMAKAREKNEVRVDSMD